VSINFQCLFPRLNGFHQEHRIIADSLHQSSRKGIFLCGDLAGDPLLKTSMQDAINTVTSIAGHLKKCNKSPECEYDVVICGAGGAGIVAAAEAARHGLKTVVLEKNKIAQTIRDFPTNKHIYANPPGLQIDSPFDFDDCSKEEFLDFFYGKIKELAIPVIESREVNAISKLDDGFAVHTADGSKYTGCAVLLAIGRRGNFRELGIPGEELSNVHHKLLTPFGYTSSEVLVVGGGNSAVESATTLADAGAHVTISYRGESFYRCTPPNLERLAAMIEQHKIKVIYNSNVSAITKENVTLKTPDETKILEFKDIFILIGADPPSQLINDLELKMENNSSWRRIITFVLAFVAVWLFYSFSKWNNGTSIVEFPFSLFGKSYEILPSWFNPGQFKGLIYSLFVIGFGIPALLRWRRKPRNQRYQTVRYVTIFISQSFLLFILPEFILKLFWPNDYWHFYGVIMPFPLVYESFFSTFSIFWLSACAIAAFVVMPIVVYWHGKRFCSWVCGCGCLAETFGDRYRHHAPQGDISRKIENPLLWPVLIWAFISASLYILIFHGHGAYPWYVWLYVGLVDFFLAAVLGIALYFVFGNRIWCRYFCPLAHYMRLLSAWYGKFRIKSADRCIACGECSRHCQMGIDVMKFSLKREDINNRNSSCIGCEICVSVCPMDNLTTRDKFPNEE
jgi:NosR/NirI family transcriptional regulator, nitrous oxide reductase regulator